MIYRAIAGRLSFSVILAAALLMAVLLILGDAPTANADVQAAYWAVCPQAPDDGCDYATIQEAVDVAGEGDTVRVVGNNSYQERVVITKSLTLVGGCANAACSVRMPRFFETVVDGNSSGRVITIDGDGELITVTVDGFTITGGDLTSISGDPYKEGGGVGSWDANLILSHNIITGNFGAADALVTGGGVYVYSGTVDIANNQILGNQAGGPSGNDQYGGGIALMEVSGQMESNLVQNNVAAGASGFGMGGGVYIDECGTLTVTDNVIRDNTAAVSDGAYAGGLFARGCVITLMDNVIYANTASVENEGRGGGIEINKAAAFLYGNTIQENVASHNDRGYGGGVWFFQSDVVLDHNTILSNVATINGDEGYGGGLGLDYRATAILSGDTIVSNTAGSSVSSLYGNGFLVDRSAHLTATNIVVAWNHAGDAGPAITVDTDETTWATSTVTLVNSTVVDNAYEGVRCGSDASVTLINSILWGNGDDLNCTVADLFYSDVEDGDTGPGVIHQNPLFVDPARGDYHLLPDSPCIDAGASPVTHTLVPDWDWDGDSRPIDDGYDIGADEAWWTNTYLPLVLRKSQ